MVLEQKGDLFQSDDLVRAGAYPSRHWARDANSTQKGPCWDLNQEPPCCELTVLTTI